MSSLRGTFITRLADFYHMGKKTPLLPDFLTFQGELENWIFFLMRYCNVS